MITLIGLLAAILTTFGGIPQVIQVYKTKKTEGLSLMTIIIFFIGVCLWLAYGIMLNDTPLMLANSVSLLIQGSLLYLKIKYK